MSFTTIWLKKWTELTTAHKLRFMVRSDMEHPDFGKFFERNTIESDYHPSKLFKEIDGTYTINELGAYPEGEFRILNEYGEIFNKTDIDDELIVLLANFYAREVLYKQVLTDEVYNILRDVYRFELENYNRGNYVFYHGQSADIGLVNYAIYLGKKRTEDYESKCKIVYKQQGKLGTPWKPAYEKGIELGLGRQADKSSSVLDWDPTVRSMIYSVNYSLFGNFDAIRSGENTLKYFIKNTNESCASQYVSYIPNINRNEEWELNELFEEFEDNYEGVGRILAFVIPFDKIDTYVFNARPGGVLSKEPIISDINFDGLSINLILYRLG